MDITAMSPFIGIIELCRLVTCPYAISWYTHFVNRMFQVLSTDRAGSVLLSRVRCVWISIFIIILEYSE